MGVNFRNYDNSQSMGQRGDIDIYDNNTTKIDALRRSLPIESNFTSGSIVGPGCSTDQQEVYVENGKVIFSVFCPGSGYHYLDMKDYTPYSTITLTRYNKLEISYPERDIYKELSKHMSLEADQRYSSYCNMGHLSLEGNGVYLYSDCEGRHFRTNVTEFSLGNSYLHYTYNVFPIQRYVNFLKK